MRLTIRVCALLVALSCAASLASAENVWVKGYVTKNGTYVLGHFQTAPDRTVINNYSFYGNVNPYTATVGTNRYYNAPSSPYYVGSYGSTVRGANLYGSSLYGSGYTSGIYGGGYRPYGTGLYQTRTLYTPYAR